MCGRSTTCSIASNSAASAGSCSYTSSPAAASRCVASACTSARSSTTSPRDVLTRIACGRIRASASAPMRCRVAGVARQWSETKSLATSSSSSVPQRRTPGTSVADAASDGDHASTRIPKPRRARSATARPMRPNPTMPSVLPATRVPSSCVGRHPLQLPARTMRSPSPARRAVASRSVIARSAVSSVRTSGVLVTTMPAARAAPRSMCPKPAPKFARIRARRGCDTRSAALTPSVIVQSTPSAPRNACASDAGVDGTSVALSSTSNSAASCRSTGSGRRRVTTTRGRAVMRAPRSGAALRSCAD